jgi:hypothetical protein
MKEEIFIPSFFNFGELGEIPPLQNNKSGGVLPRAGMEITKQKKV